MCVYILESPVQPLAKPKSQSLIMGGYESPKSPRSSSVLSSFKSLQVVLVLGREGIFGVHVSFPLLLLLKIT